MNTILEHQQLEMKNLISFRGKVLQEEIPAVMQKMKAYADEQGVKPAGGPVSVTFAVEQTPEGVSTDMELMMPVDDRVSGNEEFTWKERLLLTNAVMLHYTGTPALFQDACNELNAYIQGKKQAPITAGYTVTKSADQLSGMVEMEVYVGLSPNIL